MRCRRPAHGGELKSRVPGKRRLHLAIGLLAVLLGPSAVAWSAEPTRVLILHSYHPGLSWTDALQQGFEQTFADQPEEIELFVEYMDTKHHDPRKTAEPLAALLRTKYETWKPELIVSCDDDALAFLFRYRDELFPGVPVVFCGLNVEDFDPAVLQGRSGYTGVVERLDLASTADLILQLFPKVRRIAVIHDRTTTGLADRRTFESLADRYVASNVRFVFPDKGQGLTEEELLDFLRKLPSDSAVYFVGFFRDRNNQPLDLHIILPEICRTSPVPVFAAAEAFFGYGILGGKLLCGEVHARSTAKMALEILRSDAKTMPPVRVESSNRYMFDYRQMQRFGLDQDDLPQGSIVRYGQPGFLRRHRTAVVWISAGVAGLILFSLGLLINTFRRRAVERQLAEREAKYRLLADFSTDMISTHDMEGVFLYASPASKSLVGYDPLELIGHSAYDFFHPEDMQATRQTHESIRNGKPMHTVAFRFRHKQGHYVWLETTTRVIDTPQAMQIICVSRDITPRKRAQEKLRESRETLGRFFDTPHVAMAISRRSDGQYLEVNPGFELLTGYPAQELLGRTSVELGLFTSQQRQEMVEKLGANQSLRNEEMTFRTKQGQKKTILFSLHPITRGQEECLSATMMDVTQRKAAQRALADSERRYRHLVENLPDIVYVFSSSRGAMYWSDRVQDTLGIGPDEVGSHPFLWYEQIEDEDKPRVKEAIGQARQGKSFDLEYRIRNRKGDLRWLRDRSISHRWEGDDCIIEGIATDITARKDAESQRVFLEEQLRQAQKMEAVGRLAGGIAHDFNNMLQTILGFSDILIQSKESDDPDAEALSEIHSAAQRSADLTRQLLAYARKQAYSPQILDLNETVRERLSMLRRLIGESIDLQWRPGEPGQVHMDPAQLDQVLTNLVLNARDAIESTGTITIRTDRQVIDDDFCRNHLDATQGSFATLVVQDDGQGMDSETLGRLFEPFYTTKPQGKGTGLGLSTVYGIVKQNGGFALAQSTKGSGATLKVFLPEAAEEQSTPTHPQTPASPPPTGQTILVVEDESSVLTFARRVLEHLGYDVLAASNPSMALETVRSSEKEIALLLTDLVMPEMTGQELRNAITRIRPDIKCLFMSGYTAGVMRRDGLLTQGEAFVQKPFTPRQLEESLRELLVAKDR
jgi:PAS domain S-box-containing protein